MLDTQAKVVPPANLVRRILLRILWFLVFAAVIGYVVNHAITLSNRPAGPAGFGRGVLHGALMPAAMPNLLVGRDVSIYAANNTGRTYKLGYTVGVNGCGAIFFGISFWRFNRWRKRAKPQG
ncbi:MAG: hypothetical protein JWR69_2111 [Pedosphaera sp.]|nr:hypothetical protein [Pedosphaera sp.]